MKEKPKTRSNKYELETTDTKIEIEEELEEETKPSILGKVLLIVGILFLIFYIYSFIICPNSFKIKEYKVSSAILPKSFEGLKIVHFADIHYGTSINKKQLDKIVTKINETKPDIIVFTGDLIDKNILPNEDVQKELIASLKELKASLYKYAVIGNEDDDEIFNKIMTETDFKVLSNESVLLYYKEKTPIVITGFNNIESNPDYNLMNNKIDDIDPTNLFHIVLFHESNAVDYILDNNPSLVLSSGTLGGKMNIIKPMFLPKTANKYYDDYYEIDNTQVYVTNGLGTTGVNLRFNNVPSVNLYRLYKEEN